MPFHCESHYEFSFKPITHALKAFHLISVKLRSFGRFQFQIMVLNLNNFACMGFVLVSCFLVGSSHFCYGIVAIFDHSMGFCMSHHLSILLLSYLFCRIFMLILMILPRLLSFANYLGLFIVIDVLSDYVCLDQLFALLMNLLAEIVLIYTMDVQSLLNFQVYESNYVTGLESHCHGMALDP